jgi:hypothetical protein
LTPQLDNECGDHSRKMQKADRWKAGSWPLYSRQFAQTAAVLADPHTEIPVATPPHLEWKSLFL